MPQAIPPQRKGTETQFNVIHRQKYANQLASINAKTQE